MEQKSMTALVSAFSRAYHCKNNAVKIFDDSIAEAILSGQEYEQISQNMAGGIKFFNPGFSGDEQAALRWVVDNQLSPTPLGRAAFAEAELKAAIAQGARQYLILGAGYDTFICRRPKWAREVEIFEVDHPLTAADKAKRLDAINFDTQPNVHFLSADLTEEKWERGLVAQAGFNVDTVSFCSLLGFAYYLPKAGFEKLLDALCAILAQGSSIVFDYPDELSYTEKAGERAKKQAMLASAAKEDMLASYSYDEMEKLLELHGFSATRHIRPHEITQMYFSEYNAADPEHKMTAADNVNYCLAVK